MAGTWLLKYKMEPTMESRKKAEHDTIIEREGERRGGGGGGFHLCKMLDFGDGGGFVCAMLFSNLGEFDEFGVWVDGDGLWC
jgi:hypothetical protein